MSGHDDYRRALARRYRPAEPCGLCGGCGFLYLDVAGDAREVAEDLRRGCPRCGGSGEEPAREGTEGLGW